MDTGEKYMNAVSNSFFKYISIFYFKFSALNIDHSIFFMQCERLGIHRGTFWHYFSGILKNGTDQWNQSWTPSSIYLTSYAKCHSWVLYVKNFTCWTSKEWRKKPHRKHQFPFPSNHFIIVPFLNAILWSQTKIFLKAIQLFFSVNIG